MRVTIRDIYKEAKIVGYKGNMSHISRLAKKTSDNPALVYVYMEDYGIAVDSVVREKLFAYIADKYHHGNYERVYRSWLRG